MTLHTIETIITVGLPIVKRLVPFLVETWGKTEKAVPLDEWLSAFSRGRTMQQIYAEAEARAKASGTSVQVAPRTNHAMADELLTAAISGVIPEEWRESDKAAAQYLRSRILTDG